MRPFARPLAVALAAALATSLAGPVPAADPKSPPPVKVGGAEGITEYRLHNGLKVLLFPEPSRPKVTVNLTVLVGSRHEGYGEAGMAHLLEHMVFKGTPTRPNLVADLKDRGAQFSGTTNFDRTNYYETLNATGDNLEFALAMEADRLVHSSIRAEDLATEFSVVRNEFESGENDPESVLYERMIAAAFVWHNYGKTVIGNRSDIEKVPVENLRAFYRKYYQPDNAVLVVAGQFDPGRALELIGRHFGTLPRPDRKLQPTYTEEPPQDGERSVTLRRVGDVAQFGVAYHVPAGAHPDHAALEVLAEVLADDPSGRLYKALVEAKKAAKVSASVDGSYDPGLLMIFASVRKGDSVAEVRDRTLAIVEGLKDAEVAPAEVDRIKTRLLKKFELANDDPNAVALELSEWAAQGDWRLRLLNRDRIERVTPAQVREVAAKYLRVSNRTTGEYLPTDRADRTEVPAAPAVAQLVEGYRGREASEAGEAFATDAEAIARRVIAADPINGIKVAFLPKKTRGGAVTLALNLRYGTAENLKGLDDAAGLLPELMIRGTARLSRQQLQDRLDQDRARLQLTPGGPGVLSVRLETQRKYLPAALDLFRQVLREPSLPADQLELLRTESLAAAEARRTDPSWLSSNRFVQILNPYPRDDVRNVPTLDERIEQLKAITLDQVRSVYADYLGADHGELAVVGDFDPAEIRPALAQIFDGWHAQRPYARVDMPFRKVAGERVVIPTPDKANAVLTGGFTLPMRDADPAYPAALIGNYIFGGGALSSRLADRLRQKDGMSYGAGSMFRAEAEDDNARLMLYAIFNPANLARVELGIREEFDRLVRGGVDSTELIRAQDGYLQSLQVGRTSDASLATKIARDLSLDRTYQFDVDRERHIRALTPDAVNDAVRKYLDPANMTSVVAGQVEEKPKADH